MVYTDINGFEWDEEKALSNWGKHGVSFEEATTVFHDLLALRKDDPRHSITEHRQLLVGESAAGNILVVVFTERWERARIISARLTNYKERREYEEKPN